MSASTKGLAGISRIFPSKDGGDFCIFGFPEVRVISPHGRNVSVGVSDLCAGIDAGIHYAVVCKELIEKKNT